MDYERELTRESLEARKQKNEEQETISSKTIAYEKEVSMLAKFEKAGNEFSEGSEWSLIETHNSVLAVLREEKTDDGDTINTMVAFQTDDIIGLEFQVNTKKEISEDLFNSFIKTFDFRTYVDKTIDGNYQGLILGDLDYDKYKGHEIDLFGHCYGPLYLQIKQALEKL